MRAHGYDAAAFHHGDPIRVPDGGEPMRDDQHGAPGHQPLERELDHALALGVQRAGRLVQQQDRTIGENRPRDREPLPLPAGQSHAALAEVAGIPLRQLRDEFCSEGGLARGAHLGFPGAQSSVADIFEDARREDDGILRHDREAGAHVPRIRVTHVDAVDAHRARLRIVEPQQQLEHRRLARARRPDQRDVLAGSHLEREVVERRGVGPRGIAEAHAVEGERPLRGRGQRDRVLRRADRGSDSEQFEQPLGGPRRALQVADHLADRADRAGDDRCVEHERRELASAELAGNDVVPADPENDADRAEDEQDHRRHQQRALPDPRHAGGKRGFHVHAESPPVLRLVTIGLDGAHLVQRLVHVRADVADAILARPREPAHAAPEEDDRDDHHRDACEHEQRQLRAGDRQHRESAGQQQQVADRHRSTGADDGLQHRRIVDQPRDHVAGARHLVESGRQPEQMVEHRAAQIRGDALPDPGDEVEPDVRRAGHHDDDAEHQRQRAVEFARVAGAKAAVDDALQALPDCKHGGRRDDERDRRVDHLSPVRSNERADAGERLQRGDGWDRRRGFRSHGRGSGRCARRAAARGRRPHVSPRGGPCRWGRLALAQGTISAIPAAGFHT